MKKIIVAFVTLASILAVLAFLFYFHVENQVRQFSTSWFFVNRLVEEPLLLTSEVFDQNHKKVGEFVGEQRYFVSLDSLPKHLIDAFIVAEDNEFFDHHGISVKSIGRAALKNFSSGRIAQGGSTITQQLARLYFLDSEQTYGRKFREALLAFAIEEKLDKRRILELYLNKIFLGNHSYGIEAASRNYFGKSATDLNIAEAALLAGLPKAPSKYAPHRYFERAKKRQKWVLMRLVEEEKLPLEVARKWWREDLSIAQNPAVSEAAAPYFIGEVEKELSRKLGPSTLSKKGLRITSSLDLKVQNSLNNRLDQYMKEIQKNLPEKTTALQSAMIVLDVESGSIVAMRGGNNFGQTQFNRATAAKRPLGSAFMPVYFTLAVDQGYGLTSSVYTNGKNVEEISGTWLPRYKLGEQEDLSMYEALLTGATSESSRLASWLGIGTINEHASKFGFDFNLKTFSIVLGSGKSSLQEAAAAYAAIARRGLFIRPYLVAKIVDQRGKTIYAHEGQDQGTNVCSEESAFVVTEALKDFVKYGIGQQDLKNTEGLAGMAGVDASLNDAWFLGFNKKYVVGIWFGADKGEIKLGKDREEVANKAGKLWRALFEELPPAQENVAVSVPKEISFKRVRLATQPKQLRTLPVYNRSMH